MVVRGGFQAKTQEWVLANPAQVFGDLGIVSFAAVYNWQDIVLWYWNPTHSDVSGQETLGRFICFFVSILNVDAAKVTKVFRPWFVTDLAGGFCVDRHHVLGALGICL